MPSVRTSAIRVGTFVVVGVALSVTALIYFGATDLLRRSQTYVTYFDRSVQGINLDSPVKFRGVSVGKVSAMEIAPDGELIQLTMSLDWNFPVKDSLGVKMNITGITGLRYLELDLASAEELDASPQVGFKPPHPIIPSIPGGFEEIETALKSVYEKFMLIDTEGISRGAKTFLRSGAEVMDRADSIITRPEFTAWVYDLNTAVDDLQEMISQLRAQRFHSRLDSMLTELHSASIQAHQGAVHMNSALTTLDADVQDLQLSQRADSLFGYINQTFNQTSDLMGQSQYSISQVVARLNISVAEMNETIEHLNGLILSLEEYPSRVLYSAPPQREK